MINESEFFDKTVTERCDKIKHILTVKGKEYVRNGDKLHNFNRGADISGQTRERVLHGFLLKHLISYFDILDDLDKGNVPSDAVIDEKLGDIITYFVIQEVSLKQRNVSVTVFDPRSQSQENY